MISVCTKLFFPEIRLEKQDVDPHSNGGQNVNKAALFDGFSISGELMKYFIFLLFHLIEAELYQVTKLGYF